MGVKREKLYLYFMTGTGNSRRVSEWLAKKAEEKAYQVGKSQLGAAYPLKIPSFDSATDTIGIVMPTHGFTAPWPVIKFALTLPFGSFTRAFVLATRAGTKIGSITLPGLEGTACYLVALILFLKGYRTHPLSICCWGASDWQNFFTHPTAAMVVGSAEIATYSDFLLNKKV